MTDLTTVWVKRSVKEFLQSLGITNVFLARA